MDKALCQLQDYNSEHYPAYGRVLEAIYTYYTYWDLVDRSIIYIISLKKY